MGRFRCFLRWLHHLLFLWLRCPATHESCLNFTKIEFGSLYLIRVGLPDAAYALSKRRDNCCGLLWYDLCLAPRIAPSSWSRRKVSQPRNVSLDCSVCEMEWRLLDMVWYQYLPLARCRVGKIIRRESSDSPSSLHDYLDWCLLGLGFDYIKLVRASNFMRHRINVITRLLRYDEWPSKAPSTLSEPHFFLASKLPKNLQLPVFAGERPLSCFFA